MISKKMLGLHGIWWSKNKKSAVVFISYLLFLLLIFSCKNPVNSDNNDNSDINNENVTKISKWELWNNSKTRLRGVNIWQKKIDIEVDGNDFLGSGVVGPPYTQEDFNNLADMGANYVNISHPGIYNQEPPYELNNDILNNLKDLIDKIGKADMFVVISFRTGPGRSEYTFYWGEDTDSDPENGWFDKKFYNEKVWDDENIQAKWVEMWKETANIFKDNKYVVGFDLMVEPNSNEVKTDIYEPSEFYEQYRNSTYNWNLFYPKIIDGIRSIDGKTPILVGGLGYSALDWLSYLTVNSDSKTLYTVHQYDPFSYTHQGSDGTITYPGNYDFDEDGNSEVFNKSWLESKLGLISNFQKNNNSIVAVNEYGAVRWVRGGDIFLDDEMDVFEQIGVNYAVWYWASSWKPYIDEVTEFNFRFGQNPENKTDQTTNKLIEIYKKYWKNNTDRPSNLNFSSKL